MVETIKKDPGSAALIAGATLDLSAIPLPPDLGNFAEPIGQVLLLVGVLTKLYRFFRSIW